MILFVSLILLSQVYFQFCECSDQDVFRDSSIPVICNKTHFMQNYVNKSRWFSNEQMVKYREVCNDEIEKNCGSGVIYITYAEEMYVKKYWWIFEAVDLFHGRENCWGMFMGVRSGDKMLEKKYLNFGSNNEFENSSRLYVPTVGGSEYDFYLYSIPYGNTLSFKMKAPDTCENEILDMLYLMLKNHTDSCQTDINFKGRQKLAESVCVLHPDDHEKRVNYMTNSVIITEGCDIIQIKKEEEEETKPFLTTSNIILIFASIILIMAILIISVALSCNNKKNNIIKRTDIQLMPNAHLKGVKRCLYEKEPFKGKESLILTEQLHHDP